MKLKTVKCSQVACYIDMEESSDILKILLSSILWFVPVAVDTVEHCTPDDGRVCRPKHVE